MVAAMFSKEQDVNAPPYAALPSRVGRVMWARSLLLRLRAPLASLMRHCPLSVQRTEPCVDVLTKYHTFAEQVQAFVSNLHAEWMADLSRGPALSFVSSVGATAGTALPSAGKGPLVRPGPLIQEQHNLRSRKMSTVVNIHDNANPTLGVVSGRSPRKRLKKRTSFVQKFGHFERQEHDGRLDRPLLRRCNIAEQVHLVCVVL